MKNLKFTPETQIFIRIDNGREVILDDIKETLYIVSGAEWYPLEDKLILVINGVTGVVLL
jgi:hypothetical protein